MANKVTVARIFLSVILLFLPVFSLPFWIVYLLAGFSDMADGWIARHWNLVSKTGERLDSFADLIFLMVCLYKIGPRLCFPAALWIWIAGIAMVRILNLLFGYVRRQKLVMMHTALNRITGLLLFLFPFFVKYGDSICFAVFLCLPATLAAVQEGFFIWTAGKESESPQ